MTEKIKLFEMFAGYGGASFALKKAGIPFECVGYSEIDKYAIQCYDQNHGKDPEKYYNEYMDKTYDLARPFNYGNAKSICAERLPDFDLLTGGFPCQAFSVAGKGLGELDTRGTLFNEIIRVAEIKQPKIMLLENVKGLTNKKHKPTFDKIISELFRIGYNVHWKVLNSKDHGIPQNRERVFFVCFRDDMENRFDWFTWPKEEELKIFLKDILEDEVDEKYYLSEKQINRIKNGRLNPEVAHTLTGGGHSGGNHSDMDAIRQPFVLSQPLKFLNRNQKNLQGKYSGCIDSCNTNGVRIDSQIRRLTPTECFRLMGFLNDEINLEGLSNTQKYKLAGNGWDINLVSKIFKEMFK